MAIANEDTSGSKPSRSAKVAGVLLSLAGMLGTLFFMFYQGEDVDRVGGGLACVLLLTLGFFTLVSERMVRLERRLEEVRTSSDAQGARPAPPNQSLNPTGNRPAS